MKMKNKTIAMLACSICLLVGISTFGDEASQTIAIDSFQKMSELIQKNTSTFFFGNRGQRMNLNFSEVSFDVKKTDSLVSPLNGIMVFKETTASGFLSVVTLTWAFQNNKWVFKTCKHESHHV